MKPHTTATLLLIALICPLLTSAQNTSESERPGITDAEARTFSLVLAVSQTKELFYKDSRGEYRMLPPSRSRTATRHSYSGSSPIVFYEKIPGPENTLIERPLVQAEFPDSYKEMLILLHPLDADWSRARAMVWDDSAQAFPSGSLQTQNISLYPVQFLVNGERFALNPKDGHTLDVDTAKGALNWRIAAKMDEEWQLVRAASTQFLKGMRQIIIVNVDVTNPETPRLDIFSLYDRAPASI